MVKGIAGDLLPGFFDTSSITKLADLTDFSSTMPIQEDELD